MMRQFFKQKIGVIVLASSIVILSIPVISLAEPHNGIESHLHDLIDNPKIPEAKKDEFKRELEKLEDAKNVKPAEKTSFKQHVEKGELEEGVLPPWNTGIVEDHEAPPGRHDVVINNIWHGKINNKLQSVYAGGLSLDSKQGILIIVTMDEDGSNVSLKEVLTPEKNGSLKIKKEENNNLMKEGNNQLILESEDGTEFSFDTESDTLY